MKFNRGYLTTRGLIRNNVRRVDVINGHISDDSTKEVNSWRVISCCCLYSPRTRGLFERAGRVEPPVGFEDSAFSSGVYIPDIFSARPRPLAAAFYFSEGRPMKNWSAPRVDYRSLIVAPLAAYKPSRVFAALTRRRVILVSGNPPPLGGKL